MIADLQIRVINLDRSTGRLQSIADDLNRAGLNWKRLRAVEPSVSDYHELYRGQQAKKYNGRHLTRGEIGCFLSHLCAIEAFLSSGEDCFLVLEDDVSIVDELVPVLSEVLHHLQSKDVAQWHCLNLTATYRSRRRLLVERDRWKLYRAYYFPILTSGLLWSRGGAESFLAHVKGKGIFLPVDQQLRFHLAETGRGLSLDRPALRLRDYSSTVQSPSVVSRRYHVPRLMRNFHNYLYAFVARCKDALRMRLRLP